MAITKQNTPYEFLVRWNNGAVSGAHIRFLEMIREDGVVLSQKEGPAQPVSLAGESGFPITDVLTALQASALADKATAEAALTAAQAQVATLQAQIDAYTPPAVAEPVADPEGPTVDDLQIRLALNALDLREAVELAVAVSDISVKDWYERAKKFKLKNPMVVALGKSMGKTDEEMAALWALAATLG